MLSEKFARYMGTPYFLIGMTVFVVVWLLWNTLAPADLRFDPYAFIFLTLMLSLQASYAAPADPARAEPPGRPRPGRPRAGPQPRRAQPRRHRVPHPRGRRPAHRPARPGHPRLRARRAARPARRAGGARAGARAARGPRGGRRRTAARQPRTGHRASRPRLVPMPQVSPDALHAALETVIDPEIRKPVTELGMVESVAADDERPRRRHDPAHGGRLSAQGDPDQGHHRGPGRRRGRHRGHRHPRGDERRAARRAQDDAARRRRRARGALRPGRLADPRLRRGVRQGRRRQVVGHGQPRGIPRGCRACASASSTPTSTASRSPACSGSRAARPRSTT